MSTTSAGQTAEASSGGLGPDPLRLDGTEDGPWEQKSVLTLDGGGIRGYASLCMLKVLMDTVANLEQNHAEGPHESSFCPRPDSARGNNPPRIAVVSEASTADAPISAPTRKTTRASSNGWGLFKRKNSAPMELQPTGESNTTEERHELSGYLPCHYFDYIFGTSTGGLNAIMLGRLRMSVDECIKRYPEMAENIFGRPRLNMRGLLKAKYNCIYLEEEVRKIVSERKPGSVTTKGRYDIYSSPDDLCRTAVVAKKIDPSGISERIFLFRTYNHELDEKVPFAAMLKNPGPAHNHEIWQVARATSAAPGYFKPMKIAGVDYSDGGAGFNNPAEEAYNEVTIKERAKGSENALLLLVSVGTGQKPDRVDRVKHKFPQLSNEKHVRRLLNMVERVGGELVQTERAHENIRLRMHKDKREYFRWTGGEQIGGLKLDEWKLKSKKRNQSTAEFIEDHVKDYMSQPSIQPRVEACAKTLVAHRRARMVDIARWRRNTYCNQYRCTYCLNLFETQAAVKNHIINDHPTKIHPTIDLDSLISQLDPIYPEYPGGPF